MNPSSHRQSRRSPGPRRHAQRGVTLLFALLTLVALMLATLALVRSVDTSTTLMGNIAFKQDATVSADQATRQALAWLTANSAVLNTDAPSSGYYASTQEMAADGSAKPPVDATGQQLASSTNRQLIDWDANSCSASQSGSYDGCLVTSASATVTNSANAARYVVFRMCSQPGDYSSSSYTGACAKPIGSSGPEAATKGSIDYSTGRFGGNSGPYYRIVVRVLGARNTASFTETIVHF